VDIQVRGNDHISTSDILNETHIKEKRLFSQGSFYNRHHFSREMDKLENYFTLHGFLDVSIMDSIEVLSETEAILHIKIIEGKQYYLRDVTLRGNTVFSDQEYLELIKDQAGKAFNTFMIREKLLDMLTIYQNSGYPLIYISDSVAVDDSVSLFINVREGPKLRIGQINITEPEHIAKQVIRREIIIAEGDWFNMENIQESKRRLYETSLFNSVNIRTGRLNGDSSAIDLDVEVIAAKFRAVDMNIGIKQGYADEAINADPVVSIGLSGSWYHNNLFDSSRRFRIETKVSSLYPAIFIPQKFELDLFYVEPWLGKYRTPFTLNPFYWYIENNRTDFKNVAWGIRAITTYRWFRRIKVQSLAEWSRSNSTGTPTVGEELYEEARKVGVKFTWDRRDNFFYPKTGFKWVVEPEMVGYVLGGGNNYLQVRTSFASYWNLFADWVFAHNINLAVAKQKDEAVDIPYEKRYFLGGNSSIRGFAQQAVGPTKIVNGEVIPDGGNFRFYTNFEIRFPIYGILGGELFYDVGNLWQDMRAASLVDLQSAFGFGLTFETPIGPARIDYGIPASPAVDFKAAQTHIAIAYAF
jgi:outer membrane protein insertion porin family